MSTQPKQKVAHTTQQQPGRGEREASGDFGVKSAATPFHVRGQARGYCRSSRSDAADLQPAGLWITSPDPQPAVRAGYPPSPSLQMLQVPAEVPGFLQILEGVAGGSQLGHLSIQAPNRRCRFGHQLDLSECLSR